MLFHTAMDWSIWVVLPSMQVTLLIVGLTTLLLVIAVAIVLRVWGPELLSRGGVTRTP